MNSKRNESLRNESLNLLGYSHKDYDLMEELQIALFHDKYKILDNIRQVFDEVMIKYSSIDVFFRRQIFILLCNTLNPPIKKRQPYDLEFVRMYVHFFFSFVKIKNVWFGDFFLKH